MKTFLPFFVLVFLAACSGNKTNTISLSAPQQMESPADTASLAPYLFTDDKGKVYLSWMERKGGEAMLKMAHLSNGQWSSPSTVSQGDNWFVNWADYPLLVSDGQNNLLAHFLEKSDNGTYTYDIKMMHSSNDGKEWSSPFVLHDDGKKAEHGFVSMIKMGDKFFASWLDGRNTVMGEGEQHHGHEEGHGGEMTLRGAVLDKKGQKTQEWELDNRVCDCCQTSAAMTDNGPIVVYRDRSEGEIRDMSLVRFVNGEWTKPATIFPDEWEINGCPVNGPRIAANGNNVVIAWFTAANKEEKVQVAFSDDGGANFSQPIRINEDKTIGRVDAEWLDENHAVVTWMEGSSIKAAIINRQGEKQPAINVATSTSERSGGFPQLCKTGDRLLVAWTDSDAKQVKVASIDLALN